MPRTGTGGATDDFFFLSYGIWLASVEFRRENSSTRHVASNFPRYTSERKHQTYRNIILSSLSPSLSLSLSLSLTHTHSRTPTHAHTHHHHITSHVWVFTYLLIVQQVSKRVRSHLLAFGRCNLVCWRRVC